MDPDDKEFNSKYEDNNTPQQSLSAFITSLPVTTGVVTFNQGTEVESTDISRTRPLSPLPTFFQNESDDTASSSGPPPSYSGKETMKSPEKILTLFESLTKQKEALTDNAEISAGLLNNCKSFIDSFPGFDDYIAERLMMLSTEARKTALDNLTVIRRTIKSACYHVDLSVSTGEWRETFIEKLASTVRDVKGIVNDDYVDRWRQGNLAEKVEQWIETEKTELETEIKDSQAEVSRLVQEAEKEKTRFRMLSIEYNNLIIETDGLNSELDKLRNKRKSFFSS